MNNLQEESAAEALSILGVQTFIGFLQRVRSDTECTAVRLANEFLDEDGTLESLFFTGETFGFQLSVEKVTERRYVVHFGCMAAPLAGDGGTWRVLLDRAGEIVRVEQRELWVS